MVLENGRKRLLIRRGETYRRQLQRLPLGRYTVTVEQYVPNRTKAQSDYLHAGPFRILKREFGFDSMEELKRALMGECWGWTTCPLTKQPVPVKAHTSAMTVEECTEFIDWLIPWAQVNHNIRLPMPSGRSTQT